MSAVKIEDEHLSLTFVMDVVASLFGPLFGLSCHLSPTFPFHHNHAHRTHNWQTQKAILA